MAGKNSGQAGLGAVTHVASSARTQSGIVRHAERNDPPFNPFDQAVAETFAAAEVLLLKKHRDYGPTNISQSPGGPLNGLRVRMWDKMARINHLIDNGATPENESLRDSFVDLMNYAAIAQMVIDGRWPSK